MCNVTIRRPSTTPSRHITVHTHSLSFLFKCNTNLEKCPCHKWTARQIFTSGNSPVEPTQRSRKQTFPAASEASSCATSNFSQAEPRQDIRACSNFAFFFFSLNRNGIIRYSLLRVAYFTEYSICEVLMIFSNGIVVYSFHNRVGSLLCECATVY